MRISNTTGPAFATIVLFIIGSLFSCTGSETAARFNNVIPKPVSASPGGNPFTLSSETGIVTEPGSEAAALIGRYLADKLRPSSGYPITVLESDAPAAGSIQLTTVDGDAQLGDEGYELTVSETGVKIVATKPAGLFMGVQTLRQLLPASIEQTTLQPGPWEIPSGSIRDFPNYTWRGSMLDVARHFLTVDEVKQYIDQISYYKMNVLHLHLSDDQGWRIEIKSWPNLTAYGSKTQVGGNGGGFYSQEEYAGIVAYAQSRYITIVPEIDLPGHTNSALASYGELNCDGKPRDLYSGTDVGFSTLCNTEVSFKFVDDVMRELASLTPGPYLHIGGDEAAATKKEDYLFFVNKFSAIVRAHGKQMIGWEEIAQADIDANAIAHHWHSAEHAKTAADKGARLVLSPATKVYLDMKYDTSTRIGYTWAALIEVDASYNWDPETQIPGVAKEKILGVEAPLWGETIKNFEDVEYLVFPRLPGVAEIGWTPSAARNWEEYKVRLGNHGPRMKGMNINFYRSPKVPWVE